MDGNSGVMNECSRGMNDYKCITIGNENHLLRPTNCLNLHGEMSKRIFKTIGFVFYRLLFAGRYCKNF